MNTEMELHRQVENLTAELQKQTERANFWESACDKLHEVAADNAALRATCAELVTDSNAISLAESLAKTSIDNAALRTELREIQVYLQHDYEHAQRIGGAVSIDPGVIAARLLGVNAALAKEATP